MSVRGKKIAIVGGGPGGLTLARLLFLQGLDVHVYERDASRGARVQGSALDLHEDSGLAALEAAGLTEQFWLHHRPDLDRLRLADPEGNILYEHARTISGEGKRPEIERGPLREILLDSLPENRVHWGHKLESAEFAGERVSLHFLNLEPVIVDFVVGADGSNSRVRPLVTADAPEYVGVSLVEGSVADAASAVPELCELLGGSALIALGSERTLAMGTKPDGSILFWAGLRSLDDEARRALERAAIPAQRTLWFRSYYPGWNRLWEALFERSASLIWRPLVTCSADQSWEARSNVTLIGDAAHVMPPYAGEGVNMAMLDALVLSRQLAAAATMLEAVSGYQKEMFARMQKMTNDTLSNTRMFYAQDAADQVVRLFKSFASVDQ